MPERIPPKSLGEHLETIEGQFTRLDEKQKNRNRYLAVAIVLLIGCLGVLGYGVLRLNANNDKLEAAVADIVAVRTAARERECERDNQQYQRARARAHEMWVSFIDRSAQASGSRPTGAAAALIEPFLQDQERAVDNEWAGRAPRACTPEAIEAHYEEAG